MRSFLGIILCLGLLCGWANPQTIQTVRLVALNGSNFNFANLDSSGNLMTASGTATPVTATGYIPPMAMTALNTTTGRFEYVHIDSNGNILTTGGGTSTTVLATAPIVATTVGSTTTVACPTCSTATSGPTPIAGATADYVALNGSGSVLTDITGNGNNGTLAGGGNAPIWVNGGLSFALQQNVSLPSALNATKSFYLAFYLNPLPQSNASVVSQPFPLLISSSLGSSGLNILTDDRNDQGSTPAFAPCAAANGNYSSCTSLFISGFNIFTFTTGTTDKYYINGIQIPVSQSGNSFGAQSSGNLFIGSSNTDIFTASGFNGILYRAVFVPTEDSATTVQAKYQKILTDVTSRSVPTSPVQLTQLSPQIYAVGDSITLGLGLTTPATQSWPANLSLTNQPNYNVINMGLSGMTLGAIIGSEPNRVGTLCNTLNGPSIGIVFAGTNDDRFSVSATNVMARVASWVQTVKKAGCRAFVGTMISRSNSGSDTFKNAYDALILTNAKSIGADGVIDFAANPLMGADGASTVPTYFQVDGVHPTAAGQLLLAAAASNALNYFFGYNSANPHSITAATYTMLAGDGYVAVTPVTTSALTLPDCVGQSGAIYTVSNLQAIGAVTVVTGSSSQLINGRAVGTPVTIPSNGSINFRDVPNAKSVSGCHWEI